MSLAALVKLIVAFFMSFLHLLAPIGGTVLREVSMTQFENWSAEQEFTREYAAEVEKTPGEDFVILNFADVQLSDDEVADTNGNMARAMMKKLIEDTDPDLITLTGDNATNTMSYYNIVDFIDSFDIPWAPVMGNHDGQGTIGEWYCAGLFEEADNCLWKNGPKDMGWGNYIVNITENGHIIHTLFMMDTHSNNTFTREDGTTVEGYDHLWDNQLEWYKWAVEGIAAVEGRTVESSVFFHIPLYESDEIYKIAYKDGEYVGEFAEGGFGVNHETVCCAPVRNNTFALAKELGSTTLFLYGHDHVNTSSFVYEGIRLSYGLKTGWGSYWENESQGGTTVTIGSDGSSTVEHHYIDPATLDF